MSYSNFSKQRSIPSITTRKSSPMTTNFAKGIYTYKPNDTMGLDELRLAQDARFDRVGEYGTRLGYKKLTEPIGKATYATSGTKGSTTGADELTDYTFTAASDATIYSVTLNLYQQLLINSYNVPKVTLTVNNEVVATSCYDPDDIGFKINNDREFIFTNGPEVKTGDTVSISVSVQSGEAKNIICTKASGQTYPYCVLNSATAGGITNVFEANIDGDKSVLFVFNDILYWQNSAGTVASIRSLPAGTKKVRFSQNVNTIRYVDGSEAPHLLTPTITSGVVTAWTDSAIEVKDLTISGDVGDTLTIQLSTITPSGIAIGDWITGQGTATAEVTAISGNDVSLIIVDTTPQTISSYDKFSVDFYQNFPAIKTGDPLTAMFNLGGVLYFMTRRNKYQMYSQSAESWTQSASNAQNGTFSQESVVCDLNYAYFANENGIYIFDGSSEASLTENTIQNVYDAIPDKENIVLDLYKNRLYVYYTSVAGGTNDHCLVYNINLKVWESFDSNANVSATSARQNASGRFICGHSKFGMLMLNEDTNSNNYSDMGQAIAFNIETAYQHYGTTSQLKRITKWRPEFASTTKPYTCECGYALDYTDQVEYAFSVDLQRQSIVYTDYVWDNPSDYNVPAIPTIHTTLPLVNGEFYRAQIRYQHIAAFEPVIFRSHTLTVQTQRIR